MTLLYDDVSAWWNCELCGAEVPVASAEVFAESVARGVGFVLPVGWRWLGGVDGDRRDACTECQAVVS